MIKASFIDKYRPYNFSDVVGQDVAIQPIINAIRKKSVPNRLLLSGPSGVGKTSLALCISRAINCKNYDIKQLRLCGKCPACEAKPTGSTVFDLISCADRTLDSKTLRDLRISMNRGRLFANYPTFFLDEFHRWSTEKNHDQLNNFVDFLPPGVFLICASYKEDAIADVLRKRFQQVQLDAPSIGQIVEILSRIVEVEKASVPQSRLVKLAEKANENPREAINLLEAYLMRRSWDKEVKL